MAATRRPPSEMLAKLDERHDELLSRLEVLNEQILAALAELVPAERGEEADQSTRHAA